jgi:hypothetical protein
MERKSSQTHPEVYTYLCGQRIKARVLTKELGAQEYNPHSNKSQTRSHKRNSGLLQKDSSAADEEETLYSLLNKKLEFVIYRKNQTSAYYNPANHLIASTYL